MQARLFLKHATFYAGFLQLAGKISALIAQKVVLGDHYRGRGHSGLGQLSRHQRGRCRDLLGCIGIIRWEIGFDGLLDECRAQERPVLEDEFGEGALGIEGVDNGVQENLVGDGKFQVLLAGEDING